MTNEQILEMVSMRLNGASVREIKEKTGATDKDIKAYLPRALAYSRNTRVDEAIGKIVYPAIREWIIAHGYTLTYAAKLIGTSPATFISASYGGNCTKENIDKILAVTGLTYEQAFKQEV